MRSLRSERLFALHFAALALSIGGFHITEACAQDAAPAVEGEPAPGVEEQREPFESPLTPQERRWLMDQYERQRSRLIPMQREERIEAELGAPSDGPQRMGPELRRIQRSLGGSVVDQFDTLQPDHRQPDARRSSGERGERERRVRMEALREAAWQLDTAANRLEGLDLYRQADRLREQAQRLRLDARDMIDGRQPDEVGMNGPSGATTWVEPGPQIEGEPADVDEESGRQAHGGPDPSPEPEPRPLPRTAPVPMPQPELAPAEDARDVE